MPKKRKRPSVGIMRKFNRDRLKKVRIAQPVSPSSTQTPVIITTSENIVSPLLSLLTDSTSSMTTSESYVLRKGTRESDKKWDTQNLQQIAILQVFSQHLNSLPKENDSDTASKFKRYSLCICTE